MNIMSGISTQLHGDLFYRVSSYRHRVFVEMLGWKLHCQNGFELDQFDRSDTVYVVSQDFSGQVNGCARLLPTSGPYLLGEIFPQLLNDNSPPNAPDVWELSRFAAVDFSQQPRSAIRQFSSDIAVALLRESMACAARHGAKALITVSPIAVERLLQHAGFRAHRAGPPVIIDGRPIVAVWIDIASNLVRSE